MKKKNFIMCIIAAFALSLCSCGTTSSGGHNNVEPSSSGGHNNVETSKEDVSSTVNVEVSNLQFGFLEKDNSTDVDTIKVEDTRKLGAFKLDTEYYLLVELDVYNIKSESNKTVVTEIELDHASYLSGKIKYSNSKAEEKPTKNSSTGENMISIECTTVVPKINESTHVRILVSLKTVQPSTNTFLYIGFVSDGLTIGGNAKSGATFGVEIEKGVLATPVISFREDVQGITWKHVKNASYYKIYVDDEPIAKTYDATDEAEGANLTIHNIFKVEGVKDICAIKIKAYSNSAYYEPSLKSNELIININGGADSSQGGNGFEQEN